MSYQEALLALANANPNIVVMTAENRAAIRDVPPALGPRFVDVGICEQTLAGMAGGLALCGRIPIVHALAPFLTMRAFEFVRTDIALPRLKVVLVGYIPGVLSDGNGPTHQSLEDVALMRSIPTMRVFCPADVDELVKSLPTLIEGDGPVYVRYTGLPAKVRHRGSAELGQAELLTRGSDVTFLAYGPLVVEAARAAAILSEQGLSVGVVNVRWLRPLDEALLLDVAANSQLLVTVEDHFLVGGLYSAVAELLVRASLRCEVLPIGFGGRWFRPGKLEAVLQAAGMNGHRMAQRVTDALEAIAA